MNAFHKFRRCLNWIWCRKNLIKSHILLLLHISLCAMARLGKLPRSVLTAAGLQPSELVETPSKRKSSMLTGFWILKCVCGCMTIKPKNCIQISSVRRSVDSRDGLQELQRKATELCQNLKQVLILKKYTTVSCDSAYCHCTAQSCDPIGSSWFANRSLGFPWW